jgi:hypothetical protein
MPSDRWEQLAESMEAAAERLTATREALEREVEREVDSKRVLGEPRPTLTLIEGGKDA